MKLGFKENSRVLLIEAPGNYRQLLEPLPLGVVFERVASRSVKIAHVFVTEQEELLKHLSALRKTLSPEAAVWVSWPKKAAKALTTITENTVREVALPLGFVDVKVCAVTEVWSGLKLMVRRELR
jgi:hypothetical protein